MKIRRIFDKSGIPKTGFYDNVAALMLKFIGGGDYSYSHYVYIVTESAATLSALETAAELRRRR